MYFMWFISFYRVLNREPCSLPCIRTERLSFLQDRFGIYLPRSAEDNAANVTVTPAISVDSDDGEDEPNADTKSMVSRKSVVSTKSGVSKKATFKD